MLWKWELENYKESLMEKGNDNEVKKNEERIMKNEKNNKKEGNYDEIKGEEE